MSVKYVARYSLIKCVFIEMIIIAVAILLFVSTERNQSTVFSFVYDYRLENALYVFSFLNIGIALYFSSFVYDAYIRKPIVTVTADNICFETKRKASKIPTEGVSSLNNLGNGVFQIKSKYGDNILFSTLILESPQKLIDHLSKAIMGQD